MQDVKGTSVAQSKTLRSNRPCLRRPDAHGRCCNGVLGRYSESVHTLFTTSAAAADKERNERMVDGCSEACLMKALTDSYRRPRLHRVATVSDLRRSRRLLYSPQIEATDPATNGRWAFFMRLSRCNLHRTRVQ